MVSEQHGLGRLYAPDADDHKFLMARKMAAPLARTRRTWRRGGKLIPLNQGATGTCVGHGWSHFLLTSPLRNKLPMSPYDLYRKIIMVDEWPGNDNEATGADSDLQSGTSVRAGAKVLQELGYLKEYSWAFTGDVARRWVLDASPVVLGTNWAWQMMSTDANGFVHPDGGLAGGHCYLFHGTDLNEKRDDGKRGVDYFLNSWGPGWGNKGVFKMRAEDTDALIAAQGEACTSSELIHA